MLPNSLTLLTWKEVRAHVLRLNPTLGQYMDAIRGVNEFPVIRCRYPFGAPIIQAGQFQLFLTDRSVAYRSHFVPAEIRDALHYHWKAIPFGMVMHHTFEWFVDRQKQVIPMGCFDPGNTFAKMVIFDPPETTHFIAQLDYSHAGARSLFMLPRLDNSQGNHELSLHLGIHEHLYPKTLAAHWSLFKAVYDATPAPPVWYCELLLFSAPFLNKDIPGSMEMQHHLLKSAWNSIGFIRHKFSYDSIWIEFCQQLPRDIQTNVMVIETTWHLLQSLVSSLFWNHSLVAPTDSIELGPLALLEQQFLHIYGLKQLPIFMASTRYDQVQPAYFSLQCPIFWHPLSHTPEADTLQTLKAIKSIVTQFYAFIYRYDDERDVLFDTPMYRRLKAVEFDFFHPRGTQGIRHDLEVIPNEDPRFTARFKNDSKYSGLSFPYDSPFFEGCIRLRPAVTPVKQHQELTVKLHSGKTVALTLREYQCFCAMGRRLPIKNIALELNISTRTVESHCTNLRQKLECSSKEQAIELWKLNQRTDSK